MGAGKHQTKTPVRNFGLFCSGFDCFGRFFELVGGCFAPVRSRDIEKLAARNRHQPGFRILRTAIAWPVGECRRECLRERILGGSHIAGSRREKSDQLAVTATRNQICRIVCVAFTAIHRVTSAHIGRTSTTPCCEPGQRAAQERAASRSLTSIRKYPPSCSLVSA